MVLPGQASEAVQPLTITAHALAGRYLGVYERAGAADHPLIQWWLSLCGFGLDARDEIPWCSAFVNGIAWELELPRSGSAAARSWLRVGEFVEPADALVGFDVVVLSRGAGKQPGADVVAAPGHVGFFGGATSRGGRVLVLGGNQGDHVSAEYFDAARVLGVRRLRGATVAPGEVRRSLGGDRR